MADITVRRTLANYLQIEDETAIKVVQKNGADEASDDPSDWDEAFIKEMERRSKSFVDGTAKMYTWEETKQAAIERCS